MNIKSSGGEPVRKTYIVIVLAMVALVALLAIPIEGNGGITSSNRNSNCNNCHSSDGSISVGLSSPTTQVTPGQQVAVTVTTSGTGSNSGRVGIVLSTPSGAQPSSAGWAVVMDPSQSTSFNNYVDMSGPSSGTYIWTLTAPNTVGSYSLMARAAFDKNGNTVYGDSSSQLSFTVASSTSTLPSVSISSPVDGAVVTGNVTVIASVTPGNDTVSYVQVMIDGAQVGNLTSSPYSFVLDTTKYSDGPHIINVTASGPSGTIASKDQTINVQNQGAAETGDEDLGNELTLTIVAGSLAAVAVFAGLLVLVSSSLRRRRDR
jgi:hypothetical protein